MLGAEPGQQGSIQIKEDSLGIQFLLSSVKLLQTHLGQEVYYHR